MLTLNKLGLLVVGDIEMAITWKLFELEQHIIAIEKLFQRTYNICKLGQNSCQERSKH